MKAFMITGTLTYSLNLFYFNSWQEEDLKRVYVRLNKMPLVLFYISMITLCVLLLEPKMIFHMS